ncbi:membrane protein [Mycobacterium phage Pipsqueaks]|uniref:Lipoprotein n=2 Tax=Charlievirus Pipsqueaks TaxID=2169810 RepID=A0A142K7V4_9CAUD|nr:membrane protein [Mycobacterium phage Pipsqueaks]AMS02187.1 hypothetical protein SEA_PIPSQUEAKS_34 [Mycobacterium phage Pipsqueaks]QNJ57567.1 hypothetical protein SEA_SCHNAUZER_34 [Mycobacterium phage Schnauzer]
MANGVGRGMVVAIATGAFVAGCAGGCMIGGTSDDVSSKTATTTVTRTVDNALGRTAAVPAPIEPPVAQATGCSEAPAKVVDVINASFTNGEHLENAQSISGPSGMVIVGGNITTPSGERVSSQDSWVMSDATVYALTSDARRHTMLPDGRQLIDNWPEYNDAVGTCVGIATRSGS